jgi:hypothetical protein
MRLQSRILLSAMAMVGVICMCIVACSDEETAAVATDAGFDSTPREDTSVTPSTRECTADTLCFDIRPARAGTTPLAGRLVLAWVQLNDDGPDPAPKIGYEVPFAGTETRIVIPIGQIALPDEPNLYCHRSCTDEAMCPCLADPKVGIAFVGVVPAGADGGVTPRVGLAQMVVGYSDKAFKPAPPFQPGVYAASDWLFPDGIDEGVRGYSLVPRDGSTRNSFGIPPSGTIFTLEVCDTTDRTVCSPKGLNLG